MQNLCALIRDENGATAIEYGLIVALIAVVAIVALSQMGENLNGTYSTIATNLSDANQ